jgi:hypothetical protein
LFRKSVICVLSDEIMIGIIVAPGVVLSIAFYRLKFYFISYTVYIIQVEIYLGTPPPSTGMHIMKKSDSFVCISVMLFGCKNKVLDMLRVAVQCSYALNDIAYKKVIFFARNLDLVPIKRWPFQREFVVNDFV